MTIRSSPTRPDRALLARGAALCLAGRMGFAGPHGPSGVLLCLLGLLLAAAPAFAQGGSRLSADLADHVSAGSPAINVIVHGGRAEVQALAARYNGANALDAPGYWSPRIALSTCLLRR